ncbi:hypothetical protein [Sphingomonas sp. GC_Shp_3]|uniref:hypothetical protein n=1 Tax=Sphingomonas sp. GC_Shp_3 TaxID=2937383 RepID=UPI00226A34DD|nr:hypothetical protein [Sphingomonas sp. GC_Shp_3]
MSGAVLSTWAFVAVAGLIAALAFALAQVTAGAGMILVALGATAWTAYVVRRGAMLRARHD